MVVSIKESGASCATIGGVILISNFGIDSPEGTRFAPISLRVGEEYTPNGFHFLQENHQQLASNRPVHAGSGEVQRHVGRNEKVISCPDDNSHAYHFTQFFKTR